MNSTTSAIQLELDDALLRRAWCLLRPPSWPQSYEACMADALRSRMVHMYARQLLRSDAKAKGREAWPATALTTPALARERRSPGSATSPVVIDRKRAAAGDRDDD
ncbi:hypothetical protein [Hydrogenophaga sp. ANAO-22]|uniref:hypothetical protein n=1 Tax=Hydrogenophaga sp. ANAO-22 TaxID=3166645 RepID=UPI0036D3CE74